MQNVNILAVIVLALSSFVLGGLWYSAPPGGDPVAHRRRLPYRAIRDLLRDPQSLARWTRGKYEPRYMPGQRLYFAQCRPRDRARIVVDHSVLDSPKIVVRNEGRR
jgi:hypothetical protein